MSRPNTDKGYNILKVYRQLKRMSQQDMADHLSINVGTYCNKENQEAVFSLNEARAISQLFNKSIEDIFFSNTINI